MWSGVRPTWTSALLFVCILYVRADEAVGVRDPHGLVLPILYSAGIVLKK